MAQLNVARIGRPVPQGGYWLWVGGPVPPGSAAITLGSLVIVRADAAKRTSFERLLRHELVHVRQYRELGYVRFLARYLCAYGHWRLRGYGHDASYRRIPAEVEAVWESTKGAELEL